jgi:hypothetical protein
MAWVHCWGCGKSTTLRTLLRLFLATALTCAIAFSAEFNPKGGTAELSGMAGLNIGPSGLGNHPLVGGGIQIYANKWLSFGGDGAWAPMANESFGYGVKANTNLYSLMAGGQVHIANNSRFVPYFTAAAGGIRVTGKATLGGVKYFGGSENAFAGNFGGGLRAYVTRRFGIRFEATGIKGRDTRIFGRALVGVFGQFGGR